VRAPQPDIVHETAFALRVVGELTAQWGVAKCRWWLDRPVNNSGRLKKIILDMAAGAGWPWEVELVQNPDRVLSATEQIVSSSDHVILDRCQRWLNLARLAIGGRIPKAWVLDFSFEV
jgi:hypothetical protein